MEQAQADALGHRSGNALLPASCLQLAQPWNCEQVPQHPWHVLATITIKSSSSSSLIIVLFFVKLITSPA